VRDKQILLLLARPLAHRHRPASPATENTLANGS
jgi:hypothetical protein